MKIIRINIDNTKNRLREFEEKHQLKSEDFYKKFNKGKMGDSEEIMLYASEYAALLEIQKEYGDLRKVLASWNT